MSLNLKNHSDKNDTHMERGTLLGVGMGCNFLCKGKQGCSACLGYVFASSAI